VGLFRRLDVGGFNLPPFLAPGRYFPSPPAVGADELGRLDKAADIVENLLDALLQVGG